MKTLLLVGLLVLVIGLAVYQAATLDPMELHEKLWKAQRQACQAELGDSSTA